MRRLAAALLAALWSCAPAPAGDEAQAPAATIELIAPDTSIQPADSASQALAYRVDGILETLDAAISNGDIILRRYERQPGGILPVPDTSATPTDVGVLVDAQGRVTGAVIGDPAYPNGGRFTTYLFDDDGRTIGIEIAFADHENGCAELLDVQLRWVLRGGTAVQYSRRLRDQDEYDVATDDCMVGAGERHTVHASWAELARSVGLDPAGLN